MGRRIPPPSPRAVDYPPTSTPLGWRDGYSAMDRPSHLFGPSPPEWRTKRTIALKARGLPHPPWGR